LSAIATPPAEEHLPGGTPEGPSPEPAPRRNRTWIAIAVVVLVLGGLRLFVLEPFGIPSDSMAPTLVPGDHVLVDRLAYRDDLPRRGELAVFHAPGSGELTLKRVVAVEGQTVALEDGRLVVDGRRPAEPYANADSIDSVFFGPVRVPPDAVFVLGDNRFDSKDSRSFGAVSADDLVGRVRARFWPPSRITLNP
jgi:signal peptidase I